ncbi:MAG: HNH endonuclease [Hyphomicrobiales bacterium]|nr:MAG: HNH endonuclease [Hyphomicrobiales bacterium]
MKHLYYGPYRAWVRRHLVKLQGGRCCYCKRPFTKRGPTRATIEHKRAKMDGGTDDLANLSAACEHCNRHRGRQMNLSRRSAIANLAQSATSSAEPNVPAP